MPKLIYLLTQDDLTLLAQGQPVRVGEAELMLDPDARPASRSRPASTNSHLDPDADPERTPIDRARTLMVKARKRATNLGKNRQRPRLTPAQRRKVVTLLKAAQREDPTLSLKKFSALINLSEPALRRAVKAETS